MKHACAWMNLGVGLQETKNKQLVDVMEVAGKVSPPGTIVGEMSRQTSSGGRSVENLDFVNPIYEPDESVQQISMSKSTNIVEPH